MSNSKRWDRQIFNHYAPAVAYVEIESPNGDRGIGTAFHVGEGIYVTARHVVEGQTIVGINHVVEFPIQASPGVAKPLDEVGDDPNRRQLPRTGPFFHPDPRIDVACFTLLWYPPTEIEIGFHCKDLPYGNYDFLLDKCLLMGFPPTPFSKEPILVATIGEVNACVKRYDHDFDHYIVSSMARGGFSGAPALVHFNEHLDVHAGTMALGLITESLSKNGEPAELGYMTVLTAEPIHECIEANKNKLFGKAA
ncbi:S1 family peptidase [Burkholderia gladioli]|uniref:S1 family peptidase n=1 Tax=Burkholderia gladioli TaxID=28095 RepID=UPI00163E27C8|nr:serine protease [Burkholderia gladioli]